MVVLDVLKLESPGALKSTREFSRGAFDGKTRPTLYTVDDLRASCRELDAAAARPWVILSGGVRIEEFAVAAELSAESGASGFRCGRALWQDALPFFPDISAMRGWLERDGVANARRAAEAASRARPWHAHPAMARWEGRALEPALEGW